MSLDVGDEQGTVVEGSQSGLGKGSAQSRSLDEPVSGTLVRRSSRVLKYLKEYLVR